MKNVSHNFPKPENLKVSVNFDLILLNELINESTKCLL